MSGLNDSAKINVDWAWECYGPDGELKWADGYRNTVVNTGLDDVLDKYLKGSSYTAGFFVGLKGAGSVVAGDTMASHAGWSEIAAYSESVRQTLTLGSVSGQSVDNSASKATFSINGTATVAGAFLTTNSTKSGTTGTLFSAGDFSSSRAVSNGDTLNVQVTVSAS